MMELQLLVQMQVVSRQSPAYGGIFPLQRQERVAPVRKAPLLQITDFPVRRLPGVLPLPVVKTEQSPNI